MMTFEEQFPSFPKSESEVPEDIKVNGNLWDEAHIMIYCLDKQRVKAVIEAYMDSKSYKKLSKNPESETTKVVCIILDAAKEALLKELGL